MAIDIFLSRPTRVEEQYEAGLRAFLTRLTDLDLIPHTLGSTDYLPSSPLDGVIRLLERCKGAVILGFPQILVRDGLLRGTAIGEPIVLPTEWNHIEAGLAYARRLPLLVIHHTGISRGIFDHGALASFIFAKNLADPAWPSTEDISGAVRAWRDDVLGFAPTPAAARHPVEEALSKDIGSIWTIQSIGRKIDDPRQLEARYRESAECRIEELTSFYVRVHLISASRTVTIPLGDIVISVDDKRGRPMIELRA